MRRDGLKGYRAPNYPRRDELGDRALVRWMPSRWRRSSKVAAGMAILFAAPAGADVTPPQTGDQKRGTGPQQGYDFKPRAPRLAADARRDGTVRLGVFYDPMARVDWEEEDDGHYKAPPNQRGRDQLRAQVRDFIAWLRAEKVL